MSLKGKGSRDVALPAYMTLSWDRDAIHAHAVFTPTETHPVGPGQLNEVMAVLTAAAIKDPDAEAVKNALANVEAGKAVLVASGIAPQPGKNGHVDYRVKVDTDQIDLIENEDGRIDLRELNMFENVEKGKVLAVLVGPKEGVAGVDVFGIKVPPTSGRPGELLTGTNVVKMDEGKKAVAGCDGMAGLRHGRLEVLPIYQVKGDVAYATGNIRFSGNVHIDGGVREEFVVEATDSVFIKQSIERAVVSAGKNIEVGLGITGRAGTVVSAGESIKAKFANSATLHAGEKIVIEGELLRCECVADVIQVDGPKGSAKGGKLQANNEIRLREVGDARSEMETALILSPPDDDVARLRELLAEVQTLQEEIAEKNKVLARLRNSTDPNRKRLMKEIKIAAKQERVLKRDIKKLDAKVERCKQGSIVVTGHVFPGTTVRIWDAEHVVTTSVLGAKFSYMRNKIRVSSV